VFDRLRALWRGADVAGLSLRLKGLEEAVWPELYRQHREIADLQREVSTQRDVIRSLLSDVDELRRRGFHSFTDEYGTGMEV